MEESQYRMTIVAHLIDLKDKLDFLRKSLRDDGDYKVKWTETKMMVAKIDTMFSFLENF